MALRLVTNIFAHQASSRHVEKSIFSPKSRDEAVLIYPIDLLRHHNLFIDN